MVAEKKAFEIVARSLGIDLPIVSDGQPTGGAGLPVTIAEQYSRRVAILLVHGMRDSAHAAIDEAFAAAGEFDPVTTDTQIDKLFSDKVANNLSDVGIVTIGDLVGTTEAQLILITNVREGTVKVIKEVLGKHGFRLAINNFGVET
jgi:hypothetical protein